MALQGMPCKTNEANNWGFGSQCGSILIYLVAVLMLAGALSAGIVSMTTTSTFSELGYNPSARARYLALSGIKYAQWAWDLKDTYDPLDLSGDWLDGNSEKKIVLGDNQGEIQLAFTSDGSSSQVQSMGTVFTGTFRESSFILKKDL